ncbi:MAG: phosphoenolpyruvate carboxykinase (ATP) [Taibaiella sp.]|jgi:phosphoenolpyruvate carboxykinase (ATP)
MEQEVLKQIGLEQSTQVHYNLPVSKLVEATIIKDQGVLTDSGALACDTGQFTGRSPKDKYVVADNYTQNTIWWGDVNHPLSEDAFDGIHEKMRFYLSGKEIYVKDVYACSSPEYKLNLRVITELPWQSLFAHNLFLRPTAVELEQFNVDWTILCASGFESDPVLDGTRARNFTILNFSKKIILIGGSAYTGEIKKGVFTVLNYILAEEKNVLPMHCSANIGRDGDTAIFFGLSGTGKTTLSADPERKLIGDDEHGWDSDSVFNFEGGCYAKCVNLSAEKEPQIFNAIRFGTLLENVSFFPGRTEVDYANISKTENTRAAYPIHFIENIIEPSIGKAPQNIFFLTADAFGVLPPISRLSIGQAMYHFISGYTAKVAGTEAGVTEPQTTFSACFGLPFLPLHPTRYATLLGEKLKERNINVWLINTGWTGGSYGIGQRIQLKYTRAMISSALNGHLNHIQYQEHALFGLQMPMSCPDVPDEILNPENSWENKAEYRLTAEKLAKAFTENFSQYQEFATKEITSGGPKLSK